VPADEYLGAQFAQMSEEEYAEAAGPGRRWVYHAGNDPEAFTHGVRMGNVPQNLARRRYAAGEYAEFAPGAGLGQGTYVGNEPYNISSFGHHQWAFSVPMSHLENPPEARDYGSVERNLSSAAGTGALLTHDLGRQWIVPMGRTRWSTFTGHQEHQLRAIRQGIHVPEHLQSEKVQDYLRRAKENKWDL
jgi:hypothetical protein